MQISRVDNLRKIGWLILVLSLIFCSTLDATSMAQPLEVALEQGYVPGELIVKFKLGLGKLTVKPKVGRLFTGIPSIDSLNVKFKIKAMERVFALKRGRTKARRALKVAVNLSNIYKLKLPVDSDVEAIAAQYARDPNVEYAQPNYLRRLCVTPNDPLYGEQWALSRIAAGSGWQVEQGDSTVIIAIVDTGIDYEHPDLAGNIWRNPGEILGDGVDNDGNGYVDDVIGWDFTDAPGLPGIGDYLDQDSDPMDDGGHGTHVAGIAGAVADNGIGIAGVAWNCKLMAVRAGFMTALGGLLEDDDAAAAIVYAADNGADVINLSWGAPTVSAIIRDAVEYAYGLGSVLVAAAGNEATEGLYYPAGHNQTIAVGASDFYDGLALFSNYGWDLDVIAPGVSIKSTWLDSSYATLQGTSMATPHAAGLVALILSRNPGFTPEEVHQVVRTSSDDLYSAGWDRYTGCGRINVHRGLRVERVSRASITSPGTGEGIDSSAVVTGTASGVYLESYTLDYGTGGSSTAWSRLVEPVHFQAIDETLATLDVSDFPETTYTLRLVVRNLDGSTVEDRVVIEVDHSPPQISNPMTAKRLDGDKYAHFIELETDDFTKAELFYRELGGSEFSRMDDPNLGQEHSLEISKEVSAGDFEFYVRCTNLAGLTDSTGLDTSSIDPAVIPSIGFAEQEPSLPFGYLFPETTDMDGDVYREIMVMLYPAREESLYEITYGKVEIYESANETLSLVFESTDEFLPRDVGDADGDSLMEILGVNSANTWLYESSSPGSFPDQRVWQASGVWGSLITDVDGDEKGEIVGVLDDSKAIVIFEGTDDNYSQVAILENPTGGINNTGTSLVASDFDGDSRQEILAGDGDGDVFIYEAASDDHFVNTWRDSLPLPNTTYLAAGDLDGDGVEEFAVAGNLTEVSISGLTRWLVAVYNSVGNNDYRRVWSQEVLGVEEGSGITIGDADGDGVGEVIFCARPDLYIFEWGGNDSSYSPLWYSMAGLTYRPFAGDLDRDDRPEVAFVKGEKVRLLEWEGWGPGPPVPTGLAAKPLDSTRVRVSWNGVGADGYNLHRGPAAGSLNLLQAGLKETVYVDSGLTPETTYWYAVASVVSSDTSDLSGPVSATPNAPPRVVFDSTRYVHPKHVAVLFNEPMGPSIQQPNHYMVSDGVGSPSSVVATRSGRGVILGFAQQLPETTLTVIVSDVEDTTGVPIDTTQNWGRFTVSWEKHPYLASAKPINEHEVELRFSDPMDTLTTRKAENYTISPDIEVESAVVDNLERVRLKTNLNTPFGAFGYVYTVVVEPKVKNLPGTPIQKGHGDRASFQLAMENLDRVMACPNPYRGSSSGVIKFINLTPRATIRIFTLAGELVRTLEETDGNGGIQWDLENESGQKVGAGIYIYYVEGCGDSKLDKLAIIR